MTTLTIGCGKPPKTAPVQGKVVCTGGGLLPNAGVQFIPMQSKVGQTFDANGMTGTDGRFQLYTYMRTLGKTQEGAVPGQYRVVLMPHPGGPRIPVKYSSPVDTPLKAEVRESGNPDLILEVEGAR